MPRYDYQCEGCGRQEEHTFLMSAKPDTLGCPCGSVARSVINGRVEVLVKGNARPYQLDATCLPVGWEKGNTDADLQERRYREIIGSHRKLAQENDKQAIKGGIRHIGSVPRELDRMRRNQYGKDYWQDNTKERLRQEGLLFKN